MYDSFTDGATALKRLFEASESFDLFGTQKKIESKAVEKVYGPNPVISTKEARKKMTLRSSRQTSLDDEVELLQFDPNFFSSSDKIRCRFPGCKNERERHYSSKKDLYLCPKHRRSMEERVKNMCKESGVTVPEKKYHSDIEECIKLIGWFEAAFLFFRREDLNIPKEVSKILQEMNLNLRNVLMITNALLNPDEENLYSLLPLIGIIIKTKEEVTSIIQEYKKTGKIEALQSLLELTRDVVREIFFNFGIIYKWVQLKTTELSVGSKLGVGIGGIIGLGGIVALSNPVAGGLFLVGSLVSGGFTGSGLYQLYQSDQENRRYGEFVRNHQGGNDEDDLVYEITGSPSGDLELRVYPSHRRGD